MIYERNHQDREQPYESRQTAEAKAVGSRCDRFFAEILAFPQVQFLLHWYLTPKIPQRFAESYRKAYQQYCDLAPDVTNVGNGPMTSATSARGET